MEKWHSTGHLKEPIIDYSTGRAMVMFAPVEDFRDAYDELKDKPLDIEIRKHRERRSLNANSLFHALVGEIADVLGVSKPYCKNMLITRYGQQDFLDDGTEVVIKTNIPPETMMEQEDLHCQPVKSDDNVTFYRVYRGTHTYDTREMSILIDGTIQEAKDLGLETPTSEEMRRSLEEWEKHHNKQPE